MSDGGEPLRDRFKLALPPTNTDYIRHEPRSSTG